MGQFAQSYIIKPVLAQRTEESGIPCDVPHLVRYGGPIEIGAERDVVDPYSLGDVVDVAHQVCQRGISSESSIRA